MVQTRCRQPPDEESPQKEHSLEMVEHIDDAIPKLDEFI